MSSSNELSPLLEPLKAVQELLNHYPGQGMIIGGIAASLLGRPRLTADIDAVILLPIDDIPQLIQAAIREGLEPRINEAGEFARRNRVLLLRHIRTGIGVDISLGLLPLEIEAIERSVTHRLGDLSVKLPTPEDLIIFKAIAHRPRDLLDIQAVAENHPELDRKRIETWVKEFARLMESPELWEDIAGLLGEHHSGL